MWMIQPRKGEVKVNQTSYLVELMMITHTMLKCLEQPQQCQTPRKPTCNWRKKACSLQSYTERRDGESEESDSKAGLPEATARENPSRIKNQDTFLSHDYINTALTIVINTNLNS